MPYRASLFFPHNILSIYLLSYQPQLADNLKYPVQSICTYPVISLVLITPLPRNPGQ